jgi:hypothetical protein
MAGSPKSFTAGIGMLGYYNKNHYCAMSFWSFSSTFAFVRIDHAANKMPFYCIVGI